MTPLVSLNMLVPFKKPVTHSIRPVPDKKIPLSRAGLRGDALPPDRKPARNVMELIR